MLVKKAPCHVNLVIIASLSKEWLFGANPVPVSILLTYGQLDPYK